MIQVIGIREIGGKTQEVFTDKGWCPNSVASLFLNPELLLAIVPPDERYDLYFTTHHVEPNGKRDFAYSDTLTFEVEELVNFDGTLTQSLRVAAVLSEVTGIGVDEILIGQTGVESLALAVALSVKKSFHSLDEIKLAMNKYKDLCYDFEFMLSQEGLGTAKVNKKAWGPGRLLRVPGVMATKRGDPWKKPRPLSPPQGSPRDLSAKLSIVPPRELPQTSS